MKLFPFSADTSLSGLPLDARIEWSIRTHPKYRQDMPYLGLPLPVRLVWQGHREQVIHEAQEWACVLGEDDKIVSEVTDLAISHLSNEVINRYIRWRYTPVARAFGSARDVLPLETVLAAHACAAELVRRGVSQVQGGGSGGLMGVWQRASTEEIARLQQKDKPPVAHTISVPLLFKLGAAGEGSARLHTPGGKTAPHVLITTRTLALLTVGRPVANFFLLGGDGMNEELAEHILALQCREKFLTPYSGLSMELIPPTFIIDQELPSGRWFFDFEASRRDNMLEAGTVSADDHPKCYVLRLGKAEENKHRVGNYDVRYFGTVGELSDFMWSVVQPVHEVQMRVIQKLKSEDTSGAETEPEEDVKA